MPDVISVYEGFNRSLFKKLLRLRIQQYYYFWWLFCQMSVILKLKSWCMAGYSPLFAAPRIVNNVSVVRTNAKRISRTFCRCMLFWMRRLSSSKDAPATARQSAPKWRGNGTLLDIVHLISKTVWLCREVLVCLTAGSNLRCLRKSAKQVHVYVHFILVYL